MGRIRTKAPKKIEIPVTQKTCPSRAKLVEEIMRKLEEAERKNEPRR